MPSPNPADPGRTKPDFRGVSIGPAASPIAPAARRIGAVDFSCAACTPAEPAGRVGSARLPLERVRVNRERLIDDLDGAVQILVTVCVADHERRRKQPATTVSWRKSVRNDCDGSPAASRVP